MEIQDLLGYSSRNEAVRIAKLCAKGDPEQKHNSRKEYQHHDPWDQIPRRCMQLDI